MKLQINRLSSIVLVVGTAAGVLSPVTRAADCYSNTVTANEPVRYWRLGEASGTVALDQMANGHGTYVNGVTLGARGMVMVQGDTAADFSGSSYVSLGSAPIISDKPNLTVEAWFNAAVVDGREHIIYSEDVALGTIFQVRIGSNNKLEYGIHDATSWDWAVGETTIVPGTWYYVAATLSESGMMLYVWDGGTLRLDGFNANAVPSVVQVARTAEIGAGRYSFDGIFTPFIGTIDEVAVYASTLTPSELAQRVTDRLPRIIANPEPVTLCPTGIASMRVVTNDVEGINYQWRLGGADISGATGPAIKLGPSDVGVYDCFVSTACGFAITAPATAVSCPGDFDCSGSTPDVNDIVAFFDAWTAGIAPADIDGSGGVPDTNDISAFFDHWLAGC